VDNNVTFPLSACLHRPRDTASRPGHNSPNLYFDCSMSAGPEHHIHTPGVRNVARLQLLSDVI